MADLMLRYAGATWKVEQSSPGLGGAVAAAPPIVVVRRCSSVGASPQRFPPRLLLPFWAA